MNYEDVHRLVQVLASSFVADTDLHRRVLYIHPDECAERIPEGFVVKITVEYASEEEAHSSVKDV